MLAVDSSVIYQGVRSKYGENLGKDREKKFFDKIIQVPFSIPMNQYNIKSYLKEFLDEEDEKEIDGYKNAIAGILGNNPRSIKRAFNRLELHKLILKGYIMDAKDRLNLFIILLIQMVEEELYDKLVQVVVQSNDAAEMCELIMKGEEYSIVRNLLELPEFVEAENGLDAVKEEQWNKFMELLLQTSQISYETSSEERKTKKITKNDETETNGV